MTHPEFVTCSQDDGSFLLRVFGLTERASVIVEKRVSIRFRLYSGALAALAIGFTLRSVACVAFPHIASTPIFEETYSVTQRSVYPLWCAMCSVLRLLVSWKTLSKKFAEELEQATTSIQCKMARPEPQMMGSLPSAFGETSHVGSMLQMSQP